MHRRMAAGAPARSLAEERAVRDVPDIDFPLRHVLSLGVAFQAQVRVILDEEFAID